MGVFLDWMSNPTLTRYNLPCVVPFPKTIDKGRILKMLQTILDGRRVLHTGFVLDDDGQPRQYSNPDKEIKVVCKEMTDEQFEEYIRDGFVRPFDLLSGEPLCRMELIDCPSNTNVLFDVHHIIADGVTLAPLMTIRDVTDAYFSQLKPDLEYGLYEYAEDEQKILQSEAYAEAKQYYADKFKGRNFLWAFILVVIMIPGTLSFIGLYMLARYIKIYALDNEFHRMIYAAAKKETIHTMRSNILIHFDRIRSLSMMTIKDTKIVNDHRMMLEAIKSKDKELAKQLVEKHLNRYRIDEAEIIEKHPEYFK